MLDYLKRQVIDLIALESRITLTTGGIAGLQTSTVPCESAGTTLFVLVPRTSDHLVNIDSEPQCVAVAQEWELRGTAERAQPQEHPDLALSARANAEWGTLVKISPTRLQIRQKDGTGYAATIDID